jgi:predicted phage terminase large subunit-like protein
VDSADTGADKLCAIVYDETEVGNYVVDVLYTDKPVEYTEPSLAKMLTRHNVEECTIEANNGGRIFKNNVERQCRLLNNNKTSFISFHQTENKDVRIFQYSAMVQNLTFMPQGWKHLFPDFAKDICGYLKAGQNAHDDAPDALTGTIERRNVRKTMTQRDISRLESMLY